MDVKVCKNCRRLFNYIYGPELCPECSRLLSNNKIETVNSTQTTVKTETVNPSVNEEEAKFEQVRDYIMMNPRTSVVQIAEANGITPSRLFEWIREDRLEFSDDSKAAWFECERCGAKIKSGRLCNRCKINK